ncbi:MAG: PA0069 family radical SAM protein, partial [bacterium]|nr:PA0069 family radical SAM protein [Candidatus Kapabacteria bacterium]
FTHSINPYRGCAHGCAYCYARPTHEFLGYNAGIDFETKIVVKRDAAKLARAEMMKKSWKPVSIAISGVTDPYQPIERELGITRSILETMLEFRNPVGIITKNALVLRDIDLLSELAKYNCVRVYLSITTLDRGLARRLEPRTSSPEQRLHAVKTLADAGVPVGVSMSPLIPGLTDSEIPSLLEAARDAGARDVFHVILRLPLAVRPIFIDWLEREEPGPASKVLNTIAGMRGGKLNLTEFGSRMGGTGARADAISNLFAIYAKRLGLNEDHAQLSTEHFRRPNPVGQESLFD